MKLLVLGAGGQVGQELLRAGWPIGWQVTGHRRAETDLADAAALKAVILDSRPDIVVNAGAYTAVDRAEGDRDACFAVNATAPGVIGTAADAVGAAVIHYSTDYVFDGNGTGGRAEEDPVAPLGVYGASKEAGERALRAATDRHVILRTSWVFAAHGSNFVRTMWRLGAERAEMRVVADQRGCPTSARSIAQATVRIARAIAEGRAAWGTFHFCGAPATSWAGLAEAVFAEMARRTGRRPNLVPITTAEYPTPARRPANSVLETGRIQAAYGILPPDWRADLAVVLDEATAGASPAGGERTA
ncbi:dTDP-4-dehydrorhamnose reductase [Stella humosa]|uniref:dTDP-4-dehydrorhamnose reductase n=1 Tax=Stella humosa TaxID=94 RepID=A0A3N1KUJ5_9PROT|nr:dTDP-4-dehydrorhamnose reductase [Stella humosa]ROP83664.1 dTDP-4-dehydrorhamnose reductase [Stella humosa]BBK33063.1 NAD(P)-dependent oxidoreductase [Stella humosa]